MLAYICNHTITWHDDMVHFYLHANKTFAITLFYYANFQQIICSFYDQCYSFYHKLTWSFCTMMNYSRIICKSYDIWHGFDYRCIDIHQLIWFYKNASDYSIKMSPGTMYRHAVNCIWVVKLLPPKHHMTR